MAKVVTLSHTFAALAAGNNPAQDFDDNYSDITDALADFGTFSNYLVDTGAANAYAATLGAGLTGTVAAGLMVQLKIANTNTGASTFAFNGGSAKNILNMDGSAMTAGQLIAGGIFNLVYDGTQWVLVGLAALTGTFTGTLTGCTTLPTYTFYYTKIGNQVTLDTDATITGTSNAVTKTITGMPAVIWPGRTVAIGARSQDNGGANAGSFATISTSGVITVAVSYAGGNWTNSGTATILLLSASYTTA